jgi:hypothetical protein
MEGPVNVLKAMEGPLRDDINPLGVRYPIHGSYQVGTRPSEAPQPCYLGAVAWSYGDTNKEAKKVKEYVPTTAESGSTRPSWSRQRERDMMRVLKPIVAGSSKAQLGLMDEEKVADPKATKGVDDQLNLPTIKGSKRASSTGGKQVKALAVASSARGHKEKQWSLTTPVLSNGSAANQKDRCALPTLRDIVPSAGPKPRAPKSAR